MRSSAGCTVECMHNGDLEFAFSLADLADKVTMASFRSKSLTVDRKPDRTFVTAADRAAEQAIRDAVAAARPDDVVSGEEFGEIPSAPRRWVVDPIDGTANYLRGVSVWATLIAFEVEGEVQVAVVSAPAMGLRWWATAGGGAFADGRSIHVSAVDDIAHAHLLYGNEEGFAAANIAEGFAGLRKRVWRTRGFGDFWQHMLVAEGSAEVAIDPFGLKEYDLIAPSLIVREAGGTFTDLAGEASVTSGSGVSSNGLLHNEYLVALASVSR